MNNKTNYFSHSSAIVETTNIGDNTRIWGFTHIMDDVIIGKSCNIGGNCFIESGVVIGDNVVIKNGISIWNGIIIESDVFLGPHMILANDLNPRSGFPKPLVKTTFRKGSTIGAGVVVLPGIDIGEYSFSGAGSVLTKSVSAQSLVYGNPAEQKGWVCVCGLKLSENFSCSCGKNFNFTNGEIIAL